MPDHDAINRGGALVSLHTDLSGFFLPVRIRQTAATAATATVWAMRNTHATKCAHVKNIRLFAYGDASASGQVAYELCRFSGATPTAGTALTLIRMRNSSTYTTGVTDARFLDTGLTVAGVVFETAFAALQCQGGLGSGHHLDMDMLDLARTWSGFELGPGEGLCIRLGATAVVGQRIAGGVFWDERL